MADGDKTSKKPKETESERWELSEKKKQPFSQPARVAANLESKEVISETEKEKEGNYVTWVKLYIKSLK